MLGPFDDARFYHDLGFSVIFCSYGEKRARDEWKESQQRRKTLEELREGCRIRCNLALVMGQISGNIIAFDADSDAALDWIKKSLPESVCGTLTARGSQHLYRAPKGIITNTRIGLHGLKLDLKAELSYVMAAPSRHPSGFRYERTGDWEKLQDSPILDPSLLEIRKPALHTPQPLESHSEKMRKAHAYAAKVDGAVWRQGYDRNTFVLGLKLVRIFGLTEDELFEVYSRWNENCQPPWSDRALRHKAADAVKTVSGSEIPQQMRNDMTAVLKNMRIDTCTFCREKKIGFDLEADGKTTFFCEPHAKTSMKAHCGLKTERKNKKEKT